MILTWTLPSSHKEGLALICFPPIHIHSSLKTQYFSVIIYALIDLLLCSSSISNMSLNLPFLCKIVPCAIQCMVLYAISLPHQLASKPFGNKIFILCISFYAVFNMMLRPKRHWVSISLLIKVNQKSLEFFLSLSLKVLHLK